MGKRLELPVGTKVAKQKKLCVTMLQEFWSNGWLAQPYQALFQYGLL